MAFRNMPHLLSLVDAETQSGTGAMGDEAKSARTMQPQKNNGWRGFLPQKFNFFKREEENVSRSVDEGTQSSQGPRPPESSGSVPRRLPRRVVPGLPRPPTFTRQNSERRERLYPIEPRVEERRAVSVDRRTNLTIKRTRSQPPISIASLSAPEVAPPDADTSTLSFVQDQKDNRAHRDVDENEDRPPSDPPPDPPPLVSTTEPIPERDGFSDDEDDGLMQEEIDSKWILNLSMHFRDKSEREKFFVTYAAEPNRWQRVTVSCDYRNALPDSLEADLKSLHFQRDKSDRIYEAIHDSLPTIQFYPTVTNLKLETEESRLHVHVTEDLNEIIHYPPASAVDYLKCPLYPEDSVQFDSHLSGFVYKVKIGGRSLIKKEIPGPDTVDEFLYEINALYKLSDSQNVIHLEGIVVSNDYSLVKGLVISVAERGALVDLLYDEKGSLPWARRERWANQIVTGLSEIHEAGFVQGDVTLSNIVIDKHDNVQIIDINRRGCPVGWEPPELRDLIEHGQRISMHIGVKTDLFQLGIVLWALARGEDEPERQERPLGFDEGAHEGTPKYYQDIVKTCLSEDPRDRLSAKELLKSFPPISEDAAVLNGMNGSAAVEGSTGHRSDKEYIDPDTAVKLEDIEAYRRRQMNSGRSNYSTEEATYADADPSTDYRFDSSGSYIVGRGRSNVSSARRRNGSPYARPLSSTSSGSEQVMHRYEHGENADLRWETVEVLDGASEMHASEGNKVKQDRLLEDRLKVEVLERSPHREPLRVRSVNESRSPLRHKKDEADLKATVRSASIPTWNFPPPLHQDSGFDESCFTNMIASATVTSPVTSNQNGSNYVASPIASTLTPNRCPAFTTPRTEIRVPSEPMPPEKSVSPSPHRGRTTRPRPISLAMSDASNPFAGLENLKTPERRVGTWANVPPSSSLELSNGSMGSGIRTLTGTSLPSQQWLGLMGTASRSESPNANTASSASASPVLEEVH